MGALRRTVWKSNGPQHDERVFRVAHRGNHGNDIERRFPLLVKDVVECGKRRFPLEKVRSFCPIEKTVRNGRDTAVHERFHAYQKTLRIHRPDGVRVSIGTAACNVHQTLEPMLHPPRSRRRVLVRNMFRERSDQILRTQLIVVTSQCRSLRWLIYHVWKPRDERLDALSAKLVLDDRRKAHAKPRIEMSPFTESGFGPRLLHPCQSHVAIALQHEGYGSLELWVVVAVLEDAVQAARSGWIEEAFRRVVQRTAEFRFEAFVKPSACPRSQLLHECARIKPRKGTHEKPMSVEHL